MQERLVFCQGWGRVDSGALACLSLSILTRIKAMTSLRNKQTKNSKLFATVKTVMTKISRDSMVCHQESPLREKLMTRY